MKSVAILLLKNCNQLDQCTCFSGPKARSQDFLMISLLHSLSFDSSVPFRPLDWLYPGGLTLSDDFSCLLLKSRVPSSLDTKQMTRTSTAYLVKSNVHLVSLFFTAVISYGAWIAFSRRQNIRAERTDSSVFRQERPVSVENLHNGVLRNGHGRTLTNN